MENVDADEIIDSHIIGTIKFDQSDLAIKRDLMRT